MKTLIALLLISTTAFATELDATEALLNTIPAGDYRGVSPDGNDCQVSVRTLSEKVAAVASENGFVKRSEVMEGASYRWNPANRPFLSSTLTTTLTGQKENLVRTIAVKQNTQYVVVADIVSEDGRVSETKIECVINL